MKKLEQFNQYLHEKKVFIGFDGYTDLLYSVVKEENSGEKEFYRCSEEFVENLRNTAGISSEYEIVLKEKRIGGNAPIMSIGMASMGADVSCAGLFDDQIEKLEERIRKHLNIFSMGEPAISLALEFQDCKYMLADCRKLEAITYDNLIQTMGEDCVKDIIWGADLIAIVNWSAVSALTEMVEHIFQKGTSDCKKIPKWLYLDLSDVRAKDFNDLKKYFNVIKQVKKYMECQVCLSVNQNEWNVLEQRYQIRAGQKQSIMKLREKIGVDEIVYHGLKEAVFCSEGVWIKTEKNVCDKPKITTGAGDNFNAGVCMAKLLELSPMEQLEMGNKAAEFYVTYGYSARLQQLIK